MSNATGAAPREWDTAANPAAQTSAISPRTRYVRRTGAVVSLIASEVLFTWSSGGRAGRWVIGVEVGSRVEIGLHPEVGSGPGEAGAVGPAHRFGPVGRA